MYGTKDRRIRTSATGGAVNLLNREIFFERRVYVARWPAAPYCDVPKRVL